MAKRRAKRSYVLYYLLLLNFLIPIIGCMVVPVFTQSLELNPFILLYGWGIPSFVVIVYRAIKFEVRQRRESSFTKQKEKKMATTKKRKENQSSGDPFIGFFLYFGAVYTIIFGGVILVASTKSPVNYSAGLVLAGALMGLVKPLKKYFILSYRYNDPEEATKAKGKRLKK
jgi:hypothetical protein